jgi:integrase/recombinase XerD
MQELYQQFIRERVAFKGVSDPTVEWYKLSFAAFSPALENKRPEQIDKGCLLSEVERLIAKGLRPVSINSYARSINAFLNWLREEKLLNNPVRIPKMKEEIPVYQTWTPEHVGRLLRFKAGCHSLRRVQVLSLLTLDCGLRLSEALYLSPEDLDLESLLLRVRRAKGKKQRLVPVSTEIAKIVMRFMKEHPPKSGLIFASESGTVVSAANARRDLATLRKAIPIKGPKPGFHIMRHSCATNFLRSGGDVFVLQKLLGHQNLEVTRRYCRLDTSDLQAKHKAHGFFR